MFNQTTYEVLESAQSVQVCLLLMGELLRPISLSLSTTPQTALPGMDYTSISSTGISTASASVCTNIDVNFDNVVENLETFLVIVQSNSDPAVNVVQQSATVNVIDSSTVDFSFSPDVYSVMENESVSVCVTLEGTTDRDIVVSLQVSDSSKCLIVGYYQVI